MGGMCIVHRCAGRVAQAQTRNYICITLYGIVL